MAQGLLLSISAMRDLHNENKAKRFGSVSLDRVFVMLYFSCTSTNDFFPKTSAELDFGRRFRFWIFQSSPPRKSFVLSKVSLLVYASLICCPLVRFLTTGRTAAVSDQCPWFCYFRLLALVWNLFTPSLLLTPTARSFHTHSLSALWPAWSQCCARKVTSVYT